MPKVITVLGINDGHDCGAALVRNGKVLAAVQEERMSNKKHHSGTPFASIKEVYKITGIHPSETDAVSVVSLNRVYSPGDEYPFRVKLFEKMSPLFHGKTFAKTYVSILAKFRDKTELNRVMTELGIQDKEVFFIEHHTAHAACAYRQAPFGYDKPVLVMTSDGTGDGLSSTVSIAENGQLKRIASTTFYSSLGNSFYSEITRYLGMKPWDHEYKCLDGDTPVLLANGSIKPIEKIFEETALNSTDKSIIDLSDEIALPCSVDVFSPDQDLRLVRSKATQVYRKHVGHGSLFRVRTVTGRGVTTTPNHKFLSLDEDGNTVFVESSKLKAGQFVGIPNKINVRPSTTNTTSNLDTERARIIEYVLTDGTITQRIERPGIAHCSANKERSDILWDRIDSSTQVEVHDTFVYDLYVPEYHTFVGGYGAMILHNTMGLAPYGKAEYLGDKMKKIIRINPKNPLEFQNIFGSYLRSMQPGLQRLLSGERFDNIAAACQEYYEELFTKWVKNAIEKTGIHELAFAGGNILNVKENKRIIEMEGVTDAFFYPPAGDEGTPAGAALETYFELCKRDGVRAEHHPVEDLYGGSEYTDEEIFAAIKAEGLEAKADNYPGGVINEVVGGLLAKGKIVARFSGRVECGPRALGDRSIIADPRNFKIVREINTAIKMRDFWMPFAPSILEERSPDYMINPRPARYMILAFDTPEKNRDDIPAAMHPQDFTVRPQTVNSWNPGYRKVIETFQAATGVGGILNTSFNLHGYPIAGSPSLAIWTLKNSGLEYLAIGSYLVHKN